MRRNEGIHERFKVWPPPLSQAITHLPIARLFALAQAADGRKSLIEPRLEALDLIVLGSQVVAGELEEGVCNLKHQDMGMIVLVAHQDALACASDAVFRVVLLQALQTCDDGGILLGLGFLDAECVVGERIQRHLLGLVRIES